MKVDSFSFDVRGDVYRIMRRPGHCEVITNDDYAGVMLFDVARLQVTRRIGFPSSYGSSGVIDAWCVRGDGDFVVAFHDEEQRACLFSLRDGTVREVAHPPWRITQGMPYDWRGDTLWLKDPDAFRFASIDATGQLRERDGFDALQENRAWRRALDRMRRAGGRCLRVQPDEGRCIAIAENRLFTVSWVDEPEHSLSAPPKLGGVTYERGWFTISAERIQQIDDAGRIVKEFAPPPAFRFNAIETLNTDVEVRANPALSNDLLGLDEANRWEMQDDVARTCTLTKLERVGVAGQHRCDDVHHPVGFDEDVLGHQPAA